MLAEALCLLGAASVSSSPRFPTASCKGVGGRVPTGAFIMILMLERRGEAGPQGGQLELSLKKKGGEREEKSLHAGLAI